MPNPETYTLSIGSIIIPVISFYYHIGRNYRHSFAIKLNSAIRVIELGQKVTNKQAIRDNFFA